MRLKRFPGLSARPQMGALKVSGIIFCSLVLAAALSAQDNTTMIFNKIGLSGSGELAKALSDPQVRPEDKVLAIRRLGELSKELHTNQSIPPSQLYNPILGVMVPQTQSQDHHLLRTAACETLALFADFSEAGNLLGALGTRMKSDPNEEVRLAAARSLGRFFKNREGAAALLVESLDTELGRGPQADNVRLMGAVIRSLGILQDKRAFVPLMRVIKSGFPTYTKREAQTSLENLKW